MSLDDLIAKLTMLGVQIEAKEGKLAINAPKNVLDKTLMQALKVHKEALLKRVGAKGASLAPLHSDTHQYSGRLSSSQSRLWFLEQLQDTQGQYNIFSAFDVEGELDLVAAEQAITQIIDRHQVLRTTYRLEQDQPQQSVCKAWDFSINQYDASAYASDTSALNEVLHSEAYLPFDLTQALPIRVSFYRVSEQIGVLTLTVHHIAADGWSMNILANEFAAIYRNLKQPDTAPLSLPKLPIQFMDYSRWQSECLAQQQWDNDLSYWRNQLENLPTIHGLPLDRKRPETAGHLGATLKRVCTAEDIQNLSELSRQLKVTEFVLLHAAFAITLARFSGETDIVIGTPVSNRLQSETHPLIGFFVNSLVLRTQVDQSGTLKDFIDAVNGVNKEAQIHQQLPFDYLVEQLKPVRQSNVSPLFQVAIALDNTPDQLIELPNVALTPREIDNNRAKFDLMLQVKPRIVVGYLNLITIHNYSTPRRSLG